MKLEKYVDKSKKKRKVVLISLGVIVLIGVSLLLYKTFASFTESAEFQVMKGKVDYFGNSDIYFAFYKGDEQLDTMPVKDNPEGLVFSHATCDNGAYIDWDENEWSLLVKNLTKSKTKCTIFFNQPTYLQLANIQIQLVESGDGLYKVEHAVSEIDEGWNKVEYRYAGINPKNYVRFNNEIWRIIGLVNVKTESGKIEQRLKIVRQDGIKGQKDFGNYCWHSNRIGYTNNWLISSLKNMLNGIYYNSESGICDTAEYEHVCIGVTCEFNSGEVIPKGLKEVQSFIDNNIIWSLGGGETYAINANEMYEKEHGNITGNKNTNPTEWTKENDPEYHNGVGLMYSSDYGYAVGGGIRDICLSKNLYDYKNSCYMYNWIYHNSSQLFITPHTVSDQQILELRTTGFVHHYYAYNSSGVWPVVYLKPSVQILSNDNLETYGSIDNPFILN